MTEVRTAHTCDLDAATLKAARALLDVVFEGEMTDEDWEHSLGGLHTLAWHEGRLIGHASVVRRRMLHAGRALRCGYIEGVGVHPDHRRTGVGTALMTPLEKAVRAAYDLGALSAADDAAAFYASRGWHLWHGPTFTLTPHGRRRTADEDGSIHVLSHLVPLDLTGALTCDWRDGDVW